MCEGYDQCSRYAKDGRIQREATAIERLLRIRAQPRIARRVRDHMKRYAIQGWHGRWQSIFEAKLPGTFNTVSRPRPPDDTNETGHRPAALHII